MRTFIFIVEPIGLVIGSLAVGILSCWALWAIFKLVRHPEWGPPIIAVPAILALAGKLPDSEFLKMALVFAVVAAIPFWSAGRDWRTAWRNRDRLAPATPDAPPPLKPVATNSDPAPAPSYRRYPALAACICEARRPARDEVKKVALRIWRESFAAPSPNLSFATRRALWRAAKVALEGSESIVK